MAQDYKKAGEENYKKQVMDTRKIVGERIKRLRCAMGLSQTGLAEKIDISQNYMSQVETGRFRLSEIKTAQLAEIFDVSVAYLLGFGHDAIDAGDFVSAKQNEDFFKTKHATISSEKLEDSDKIDETTRAIVILRNIVKDKDKLPPGDKEILKKLMQLGIQALESDPDAEKITTD